jgi:predicted DNA-binding transcriptional regulator AlpA
MSGRANQVAKTIDFPVTSAAVSVSAATATAEKLVFFENLESTYGIDYSREHLWRLQRAGKFPLAVKLSEGGRVAWLESELLAWIASRPRALTVKRQDDGGTGRRSRRGA